MSRFTDQRMGYAAGLQAPLGKAPAMEFLGALDIKVSVGHWSAGDSVDRFAPVGYHSDDPGFSSDFEAQCHRTKAAGIGPGILDLVSPLLLG